MQLKNCLPRLRKNKYEAAAGKILGSNEGISDLFLASGLALLACALRLERFHSPFWLDEALNNFNIFESENLWILRGRICGLLIPWLESAIRYCFWSPILGKSEFAVRLPSLIYSLATVLCAFWISYRQSLRAKMKFAPSIILATLIALIFSLCENQIHYGSEGQGYAFISLVSILWFSSYAYD